MKLTDKRFWNWIVMIAIIPVMMGIFTGCFLVDISYRKVLIIDTPVVIMYYG